MKHSITLSGQEATVLKNLWLNYFNDVLLDKTVITPEEHSKMAAKINTLYRIPDRPAIPRIIR